VKRRSRNRPQSSPAPLRRLYTASPRAGVETLAEILSQPDTWRETARQLAANGSLSKIQRVFSRNAPWLFVACGSSYYLARAVAAQWTRLLKADCTAAPPSEFLFARDETLARTAAKQVVLISRSGKTTEVLRLAQQLSADDGIRTMGITCNVESDLARLCTRSVTLPWADERSLVMTRAFISILLLLTQLGADFAQDTSLAAALETLPEDAAVWLGANADKIRAFGAKRSLDDFVCWVRAQITGWRRKPR